MNLMKKIASLSLLFLFSMVNAQTRIEVVKHNEVFLEPAPQITLALKETESIIIDDIRLDASLTASNAIIFNLSYKDEMGNFVMCYTSPLIEVNSGDEIGFASTEGFSLLVRVTDLEK